MSWIASRDFRRLLGLVHENVAGVVQLAHIRRVRESLHGLAKVLINRREHLQQIVVDNGILKRSKETISATEADT